MVNIDFSQCQVDSGELTMEESSPLRLGIREEEDSSPLLGESLAEAEVLYF